MTKTDFPIREVRAAFPALRRAAPFVLFDNAAGAQVPKAALDATGRHLTDFNVQRGGRYAQSRLVDEAIAAARSKVAAFLNADDPREVSFGMNATAFIRLVSLAVGRTLRPGRNEIVVTDLDHEANIATWMALPDAEIRWWRTGGDGVLHLADLAPLLSERTRLVACAAASNALGSITDVAGAARLAHASGAELFVDAVHYAPHAPIDVQAWGCDYLVCSGYKIFAPHMGFLWGRFEALTALPTFREDFIPDEPPFKIEAGTFVYENVSGMGGALDYLEDLGVRAGETGPLAARLAAAMGAIRDYERRLSARMLDVLGEAGAVIHGIADPARIAERLPTFAFDLPGVDPADLAERAASAGFALRDGHMYAPRLMRRLGLEPATGCVRASLVHYNDEDEIDRFAAFLRKIARG